jgi:GTP cyclohydrolase I
LFPQESSQDPSHKDGKQLIPLSGCLLQGLLRINETKEPEFSDNLHLETAMMSIGDATSGDKLHETCQRVAEVKNWMAGASKGADISLINSTI